MALHLGMPAERLSREMSERELAQWARIARRRGLPWQRMEWYLAQIAQVIASAHGAKDLTLANFLIELQDPVDLVTAEETKMAFAFRPRKKRAR